MSEPDTKPLHDRSQVDFTIITQQLDKHDGNKRRILSIAIWGWEASGKTTSLLTFYRYGNALEHGVSIAYVDLSEMEEVLGDSAPIHLNAARQTRTMMKPLAETFIDDAQWLPGTDRPNQYLFRVRNRRSTTLAYAYLTDLPGGSYRENDDTALSILRDAHGAVVLVDPHRYGGQSIDDREYRDEVEQRISQCEEHAVPTAVMLTKCDNASKLPEEVLRKTETNLSLLTEGYSHVRIFRTSVVGDNDWTDPDAPPPQGQRKPDQLVFAWADLLSRAACLDKHDIHTAPPLVNIQRRIGYQQTFESKIIPEVIQLGVWSACPGRVIGATVRRGGTNFITIDDSGHLYEIRIDQNQTGTPEVRSAGQLTDPPDDVADLVAQLSDGRIYVGAKHDSEHIWVGPLNDTVPRFEVPAYSSWTLAPNGVLLTSSLNGGIHAICFQPQMVTSDYRKLLSESNKPSIAVTWLSNTKCACVCDGENIAFLKMLNDQFDTKLDIPNLRPQPNPKQAPEYITLTSTPIIFAEYGFEESKPYSKIIHEERSLSATIVGEQKCFVRSISGPWTASAAHPLLATITAGGNLEITWVSEDSVSAIAEEALPAKAHSLAFSADASQIFIELADGSWAVYTLKGWPHG